MNKKFIPIMFSVLVISFSAGIFTQLQTPGNSAEISSQVPTLLQSILSYIKSDFATVLLSAVLSATVFLMPATALITVYKTFSLGFSAAFILTAYKGKGFAFLITMLLPQALLKIPVYIALIFVSFHFAVYIKENYRHRLRLSAASVHLYKFLLCFVALSISSVIQAALLQGVL